MHDSRSGRSDGPPAEAPAKIRWAPRLRPILLKRLYDLDAQGIHDLDLCDEVGITLYARCQTYILVSQGKVQCPRCGTAFAISHDSTNVCPGSNCDWHATSAAYRQSIQNHYASPGRAMSAFLSFHQHYPGARTYQEKILLIDQLIHSFHISEKTGKPAKSIASKLFEGNKKAVVQFLDDLSAIDPATRDRWRRQVANTIDRRIVEPDPPAQNDTRTDTTSATG